MVPVRCISSLRSDGLRMHLRDENYKSSCLKPQCLEPDIWYVAYPSLFKLSPILLLVVVRLSVSYAFVSEQYLQYNLR